MLKELGQADLVVAVITRKFLQSKFCLGEIGATQVMRSTHPNNLYTLLVPPLVYNDLDGVLYGTQSGHIFDIATIDGLLDRITTGVANSPNTTARNAERDRFLQNVKPFVEKQQAQEQLNLITPLDVIFDRDMSNSIKYKMKLRVILRNDSGRDITITQPTWSVAPGDVKVYPDFNSAVQVETGSGWM